MEAAAAIRPQRCFKASGETALPTIPQWRTGILMRTRLKGMFLLFIFMHVNFESYDQMNMAEMWHHANRLHTQALANQVRECCGAGVVAGRLVLLTLSSSASLKTFRTPDYYWLLLLRILDFQEWFKDKCDDVTMMSRWCHFEQKGSFNPLTIMPVGEFSTGHLRGRGLCLSGVRGGVYQVAWSFSY